MIICRVFIYCLQQFLKSRAIYKRICCGLEFYKHSYSILLLLSSDLYNLAPRGIKNLILYEIA
jgi:hypothetical protein